MAGHDRADLRRAAELLDYDIAHLGALSQRPSGDSPASRG
jgi:hypothetical protein